MFGDIFGDKNLYLNVLLIPISDVRRTVRENEFPKKKYFILFYCLPSTKRVSGYLHLRYFAILITKKSKGRDNWKENALEHHLGCHLLLPPVRVRAVLPCHIVHHVQTSPQILKASKLKSLTSRSRWARFISLPKSYPRNVTKFFNSFYSGRLHKVLTQFLQRLTIISRRCFRWDRTGVPASEPRLALVTRVQAQRSD